MDFGALVDSQRSTFRGLFVNTQFVRDLSFRGMTLAAIALLLVSACTAPSRLCIPTGSARPALQRWLLEDGKRAEVAGADPARILLAEAGAVGDRFASVVDVDEQDCLLVMARASDKIADLDLYIYNESGSILSIDDRPDAKPSLLLCPPHPRHVYITARIATGQGVVVVGAHRVTAQAAKPVRRALQLLENESRGDMADGASLDLDQRVVAHHLAIGGKWIAVAQSTIVVDSRVPAVASLVIRENSCIDALVIPTTRVSALDIEFQDNNGHTLGRAPIADGERWMVACSRESRAVTLQIRPHDGNGSVVLLVSRGTLEMGHATRQAIELGESQSLQLLTDSEHKALEHLGYSPAKILGSFQIERGFQHRFVAHARSGCTRFDVFAGAPSLGVQARIYSADGELLASDGGTQHFPLLACLPGRITVVIEAVGRGGPVQVEQRQDVIDNPHAMNLPRAAARMFQRAYNLGLAKSFGQLSSVESISLADTKILERELTLAPGQCDGYLMSLDGDATGVDLRIIDTITDEVLGGEQHIDTAHADICAPSGEKPHTYRLRATLGSGKSSALLSTIHHR
jgi:hypothetical protein